ncbi:hypothetical protein AQUCO_00800183v1 [Aquilegia coerulea]|uniref:ZF-HD dimerization-type domain-containing protein n=1 Tax=Aquilegia coerulea TaxID=218851 RepID=A0A2G5EHP2_AQUCA|nr:hypothetical protein AQUCO_00800183v1 [Aquilegia coerulea]
MDLSSHEGDIPMPITSSYGGGLGHGHGHMIHHDSQSLNHNHNHIIPSSASQVVLPSNGPINPSTLEDHMPYKKIVKYRECLKNHAAAMGGNATDGCGEFMPSGEEGSLEALKCSACNCHRNFHRKEMEGEASSFEFYHHPHLSKMGRKVIVSHHHHKMLGSDNLGYPSGTLIPSRPAPSHPMLMSYNMSSLPSESDEQDGNGGINVAVRPIHQVKKRFRTKFTQEQKDKMLNFAENSGWRIQKQEDSVVQQFCQELGIKRRVLKVWMHNNKHNLAKKIDSSPT